MQSYEGLGYVEQKAPCNLRECIPYLLHLCEYKNNARHLFLLYRLHGTPDMAWAGLQYHKEDHNRWSCYDPFHKVYLINMQTHCMDCTSLLLGSSWKGDQCILGMRCHWNILLPYPGVDMGCVQCCLLVYFDASACFMVIVNLLLSGIRDREFDDMPVAGMDFNNRTWAFSINKMYGSTCYPVHLPNAHALCRPALHAPNMHSHPGLHPNRVSCFTHCDTWCSPSHPNGCHGPKPTVPLVALCCTHMTCTLMTPDVHSLFPSHWMQWLNALHVAQHCMHAMFTPVITQSPPITPTDHRQYALLLPFPSQGIWPSNAPHITQHGMHMMCTSATFNAIHFSHLNRCNGPMQCTTCCSLPPIPTSAQVTCARMTS